MLPLPPSRFTFMANPQKRIIIIRPIGDLSGEAYVDALFAAYATVDMPWTWDRLTDLRRFDNRLSPRDHAEISRRWRELAGGRDYHAHVAVVCFDSFDHLRLPVASPDEPRETVCAFADYHEALGWLTAADKARFLEQLAPLSRVRRDDGRIRIA